MPGKNIGRKENAAKGRKAGGRKKGLFNFRKMWYSELYRTSDKTRGTNRRGLKPGNGCAFRRTVFWFRGGSRDMPRDVKNRKSTSRLPERRVLHDKNLPAEEAAPPKGTRLPQAYGYCERTQGACAPQSKGKGPPILLTKGKAGGRAKPEKQAVGGSLVGRARRPFSLKRNSLAEHDEV